MPRKYKFDMGDGVFKVKGYPFLGVIVMRGKTLYGNVRYVVEMISDDGNSTGLLHIFSETQLERRP